jgi:hypothetical protein
MRKLIFLWIALVVVSLQALANDKVSFTASAPDAVAVGDQFRLAYTVTTQKVRDFRAPSIKGFDVLMGPSRSQQSSMQIVNGLSPSAFVTLFSCAAAENSVCEPIVTESFACCNVSDAVCPEEVNAINRPTKVKNSIFFII